MTIVGNFEPIYDKRNLNSIRTPVLLPKKYVFVTYDYEDIIISCMQGIYTCIPEANYDPRE